MQSRKARIRGKPSQIEKIVVHLSQLTIGEGQFSSEVSAMGIDYHGIPISGFFPKSSIKQGQLAVELVSVAPDYNWAWVKPIGGYFLERDQGVPIIATDLVYVPD